MAHSLRLAKLIELLGGGKPSALPQCAGVTFRLGHGYDLGTPQPIVELLAALLGDGERPSGWRMGNRTVTLPVTILVPATADPVADRLLLASAREVLMQLITADEFTLTWAPDGTNGTRDTIFECYRAKAATVVYDMIREGQRLTSLTVTFDAMPYGRSDTLSTLAFDSPVTGQDAPPAQVTIDDYATVSSTTQASWWSQSPVTASGSWSARWSHNITDQNSPLWYSRTLGAGVDITGRSKLTFWFGMGTDAGRYRHWHRGQVSFTITLTDVSNRVLTFGTQQICEASDDQEWPKWNQVSASIPQGATFTYGNVTKYSIKAWSETHSWNNTIELDPTGYLAGLRAACPASPRRPASFRGGTYCLYDIDGTAPTTLNLHCQLGHIEQQPVIQTIFLPGSAGTVNNYTAPAENPDWLQEDTADFEGGTIGAWTGSDGLATNATLTASTTQKHAGAYSMRIAPASGGSNAVAASCTAANIASQGLPCAPGERIAVRAYVRAGTTTRNITLGAEFFSSVPASLGRVNLSASADSNSTFTSFNGRVTAPANAAYARLIVTVATPAGGEYHYLDDPYLAYAVQAEVACGGAGGGGGGTRNRGSAGGGGGGEIAWETNLDLTPGGTHEYGKGLGGSRGTAGPGGDGGDTYFTGSSVTVTANGGAHGAGAYNSYTNGAGGLGGTGSSNAHHYDGGDGSAGDYTQWEGGGGGGSAGDGGAGGDAGSGNHYVAGPAGASGALGLAGAAGGNGYGGHAVGDQFFGGDGFGGNSPGAGGSGSASDTQTHSGGDGANGYIRVRIKTYTAPGVFPALLIHKPSQRTPILAKPVLDVGGGGNAPDGREYTVDQVDGQNARYNGTYTVLLVNWSWHGTGARTVTATFRQYEAPGGNSVTAAVSGSVTPAQVLNGIVWLGEVTLPIRDLPPDNTDSYFTVAITSADTADRFLDLCLIDTAGQSFFININGTGYSDYYLDAPALTADLGRVSGSLSDRSQAVSVLGDTIASGGPLRLEPGDNLITVYSPSGMPALEGDYWPRWWYERLS